MAEPGKHDALNAPEPADGEEESGAGYGNHAEPEGETPVDTGLHGGDAEGAGSDQR